jgi:hypothetical protein
MGGNAGSLNPISAAITRLQPQQNTPQTEGAGYQAPPPPNVYRQQQAPAQISPFVQQQRMQQMQPQMQMQRGLGQQQYVSPLQSMLSRILSGYNPQQFNQQQFNPQRMMQQGMPQQGYGQMYRPDMAQVQQNLTRVAPPVMPPAPTPEPVAEPQATGGYGGGGD